MFEVDKQWIERVHNSMYKADAFRAENLTIRLKKLEFKFFNLLLEDEDYEEFDLIEEKINNQKWED